MQNKERDSNTDALSIHPKLIKRPWCSCSFNANILPVAYPLFLMFGTCAVYLFISCLLMRYLGSFSFQQKWKGMKRELLEIHRLSQSHKLPTTYPKASLKEMTN